MLKLPFCHPVQGKASFYKDGCMTSREVGTNEDFEVEIPLENMTSGNWEFVFQWEQNGELYSLSKNVTIE